MTPRRTTPKVLRAGATSLLLAVATIRATAATRGATPEPAAPVVAASATIDHGARCIVTNHPIIPVPAAAWPALIGVAFIARRAIGVANRAR